MTAITRISQKGVTNPTIIKVIIPAETRKYAATGVKTMSAATPKSRNLDLSRIYSSVADVSKPLALQSTIGTFTTRTLAILPPQSLTVIRPEGVAIVGLSLFSILAPMPNPNNNNSVTF